MSDSTMKKTVFFGVPRETLWQYLTQKDKLALWFLPAEADLVEGQPYALIGPESGDKLCWGEVLSMNAPESMQWTFSVQPLGGAMTNVTWLLEDANGGTRLTLTHEGIDTAAGEAALGLLMALDAGWDEHFAKLRETVAAESTVSADTSGCE